MYVKKESTNSLQPCLIDGTCLTGPLIYHLHLCLSSPQWFPSQSTSSLCDLPPRDTAALVVQQLSVLPSAVICFMPLLHSLP